MNYELGSPDFLLPDSDFCFSLDERFGWNRSECLHVCYDDQSRTVAVPISLTFLSRPLTSPDGSGIPLMMNQPKDDPA